MRTTKGPQHAQRLQLVQAVLAAAALSLLMLCLAACSGNNAGGASASARATTSVAYTTEVSDRAYQGSAASAEDARRQAEARAAAEAAAASEARAASEAAAAAARTADGIRASLDIVEDYRSSFVHGDKGAAFQKYIVLHDTEGDGRASGVVDYWDNSGAGVAAHFVVNKDGTIVQCVPLDKIAHHAGFGNTGHNAQFGVEDESRDDKIGTVSIGSNYPDYGMNSYSIGIEMVHVSGSGDYPEAQLQAVDGLIAYIDAYYGFESEIIDHKAWRLGNSDTSPEFADYLASYQAKRTHA